MYWYSHQQALCCFVHWYLRKGFRDKGCFLQVLWFVLYFPFARNPVAKRCIAFWARSQVGRHQKTQARGVSVLARRCSEPACLAAQAAVAAAVICWCAVDEVAQGWAHAFALFESFAHPESAGESELQNLVVEDLYRLPLEFLTDDEILRLF